MRWELRPLSHDLQVAARASLLKATCTRLDPRHVGLFLALPRLLDEAKSAFFSRCLPRRPTRQRKAQVAKQRVTLGYYELLRKARFSYTYVGGHSAGRVSDLAPPPSNLPHDTGRFRRELSTVQARDDRKELPEPAVHTEFAVVTFSGATVDHDMSMDASARGAGNADVEMPDRTWHSQQTGSTQAPEEGEPAQRAIHGNHNSLPDASNFFQTMTELSGIGHGISLDDLQQSGSHLASIRRESIQGIDDAADADWQDHRLGLAQQDGHVEDPAQSAQDNLIVLPPDQSSDEHGRRSPPEPSANQEPLRLQPSQTALEMPQAMPASTSVAGLGHPNDHSSRSPAHHERSVRRVPHRPPDSRTEEEELMQNAFAASRWTQWEADVSREDDEVTRALKALQPQLVEAPSPYALAHSNDQQRARLMAIVADPRQGNPAGDMHPRAVMLILCEDMGVRFKEGELLAFPV
ncbi:hypothetical protein WJX84_002409 [Apatococcus fuscideae]|uniref:Uncharacterized protein n=1 Tax=Apatococcus fuscideae TaxID=2026836 RepID=A0AAW1T6E3_9CHLO